MSNPTPNNHLATTATATATAHSPSSSRPNDVVTQPNSKRVQRLTPRVFFQSVATRIAAQPLPETSDTNAWGVLTAISTKAFNSRAQGIHIFLTADEHCIGRSVDNMRFQIDFNSISSNHCKIYRTMVKNENMGGTMSVFLKDTSTNGTYLNWEKLKKDNAAVKVSHRDIISLAGPPDHELAFTFVYREMPASAPAPAPNNAVPKRKAEELAPVTKRSKGLGLSVPKGPVSLDEFQSLQRSNMELRKQLENQVALIDTLRGENHAAVKRHENELGDAHRASAAQKSSLKYVNERLSAYMQSCAEANARISSQKVNIADLKEQLDGEKRKRKEEQEKADDLKAAIHRVQSEAQEKLKRLADAALRREREVQETINKLQESKRESSLLVETLRFKLEDTRQKLVVSIDKVHQLETQVHKEQMTSVNGTNGVIEHEQETRKLVKELESEKAAREEAWAKVSVLELERNAAMQDLHFERQRLKVAQERLMLRETQLRMFHSTTEDIQSIVAKQQEQLKSVQRNPEDEENFANTFNDLDGVIGGTLAREKEVAGYRSNNSAKAGAVTTAQKLNMDLSEISNDETSVTEKHDCDVGSEERQNMQGAEFTSAYHDLGGRGGFCSTIDGVAATLMTEVDAAGTERVIKTESPANCGGRDLNLVKCNASAKGTMQIDDDHGNVQETEGHVQTTCRQVLLHSQSNNPVDTGNNNAPVGETIRMEELVPLQVAGSSALHDLCRMVAECQNTPDTAVTRQNDERRALMWYEGCLLITSKGF